MAAAKGRAARTVPNTCKLTIIAQDPSVRIDGHMLVSQVDVPAETLAPGPCGYRVKVVDFDSSTDTLYVPLHYQYQNGLLIDPFPPPRSRRGIPAYVKRVLNTPAFHAQNVYAIVMRTLAGFEYALGRRLAWGFGGHQLHVAPHGFADANAFYSETDRALFFGYFTDHAGNLVLSCLSHDVVAHETTHAILDGLRDRFTEPSSPDQAAFHEGFADIVAILSVFGLPEIVTKLLYQPVGADGRKLGKSKFIRKDALTHQALADNVLFGLAEQMGAALSNVRGQPLRRSAALKRSRKHLQTKEYEEPHRRGEVLVAAMLNTFIGIWQKRIERLATFTGGLLDKHAVVVEGVKVASQLLTMAMRAIDYCQPVNISFGDYLSALLTADREVVFDDREHHYRRTLLAEFEAFGIDPSAGLRDQGAWARETEGFVYSRTHFDSLTRDPDEVFRFLWENRERLGLHPDAYIQVESVRPCIRVGPDGFVLRETVATYVQMLSLQASELQTSLGVTPPIGMPKTAMLNMDGGGVLVFDEYGQLKYHIPTRIEDTRRQQSRLDYLWRIGYFDEFARKKIDFALMHMARAMDSGEKHGDH